MRVGEPQHYIRRFVDTAGTVVDHSGVETTGTVVELWADGLAGVCAHRQEEQRSRATPDENREQTRRPTWTTRLDQRGRVSAHAADHSGHVTWDAPDRVFARDGHSSGK